LVPAASIFAILLFSACSSGDTGVEGGGTAPTGPTPTGPTATGPTATGPTGASMYSCDGVEGTWIYEPGELPIQGIELTLDASEVDMSGGDGTLVITGEITIPGVGGAGFTDTVELSITGTADAPAMQSTGVKVEASGALQGVPIDLAQLWPEKVALPIVTGASQC